MAYPLPMALELQTDILEKPQTVAGTGGFDLRQILSGQQADNFMAAGIQTFVDPVADAFAAEVQDTKDEINFNPSANLVEEAQRILNSPMAAKLPPGMLSGLRAAVQLQEEKAANGADAFTRGDRVWEERKERDDKDRKEQAKIADMADDANNGQLSTTPDRHGLSEQNYADLNTELQTRDGQERFMNFMRMMHPNLTDAEIRQRLEIANAITAERSGRGNADTRRTLETAPPELVEDVSGDLAQYQQMNGRDLRQGVANQANAEMGAIASDAPSYDPQSTTEASLDILAGGNANGANTLSRTSLTAQVEGQGEFAATAPSLRDHHRAALAATAPLDVRQPQLASAAPIAPVPAVNAGFDV